jgi:hypothetical protein
VKAADLWPRLSASPIFTSIGWSENVHSALRVNAARFLSPKNPSNRPSSRVPLPITAPEQAMDASVIPGLLALHVRRGDFESHCQMLADQAFPFHSFNTLSDLPDPFLPPRPDDAERGAIYARRCFPSIAEIVNRVKEVRELEVGRELKRVYVMTNGDQEWVGELKAALVRIGGWDEDVNAITIGTDMVLTQEQYWVAQAVDMDVAGRAAVFIGNGVRILFSFVLCPEY